MPMLRPSRLFTLALGATLLGCNRASTPASAGPAPFTSANPFASASPLLYQAPPFDRIHDADYQPAVEEGMRRQLAEVEGIASDTAAPSFDNTIVALERSGALLTRAFKVFIAMTQANTDDTLQRIQTEEAPRLAAHLDAIHLNDSLFRRVRSVYERRADLGLDSVRTFLVERYYRDFVRARAQRARLLGYPSLAGYVLDDQMAKTPDAAIKLLSDLVPAATAQARREAEKLQTMINKRRGGFKLAPWDWQYYAEQVRKAEYALDETQLEPYFELDRVLKDGVFFAANRLYGLTFKQRTDLPVYHPDVRVFEVFDADGTSLALWYCDYFKRDNKSGGAWEDTFVDGTGLLETRPVVFNVANFTKPAPGQPALLRFDDVKTMFHEFGHALHAMLTRVQYPRLTGTNVPTDFVEFPSQFNEHWALEPTVLAHYAKHYQTGQPMPRALVDKTKRARTFDQGFATTEYVDAALLDMGWHTLPVGPQQPDVDAFEAQALKRFAVDVAEVPPRYRTSYFAHIWNGGYYAGYYAYLWSEVLDDDAYAWFKRSEEHTSELQSPDH